MKKTWFSVGQILLTLIVVVVAAFVLWKLVAYYMFAPWTRDGHVRADVIQVAPDISGLISSVEVVDNQQVKQGQVLFVIDQARYALALRQAQATAQQRRATLDQARREDVRNRQLGNLVAAEVAEESRSRVETAEAALADANVAIDTAKLNLQRTTIVSPVDGYLNDRAPRTGEFVSAGRAVLAVVDMHSFRVDGYFEETKLRGIDIGQRVDIQVMGEPNVLRGHVQSIVAGIEDRDRTQGSNLLPNVNPAFSWVRLAQRIPVRVALDEVPADFRMIAGRTATVSVRDLSPTGKQRPAAGASGTVDASAASASATSAVPAASAASAASATQPASAAVMSGASQ
ncbi:efflux RND transporter periplasmic adaptor subunit [Paraburkholderia nemoris]|uniref:p-hydroxybenzoic acid efflux pump subunit AaeA n=1 Tax=Paraburkholderia nemoris TaxID=2793076 RepID=A0ABN7N1U5_9BURK|nr:efflux RND transporter periplasmic adaptor subunit [Paraburkholderia nemoris]KPD16246.1 membrane protein [Burkholderia sp. ST111]MBK3743605.1 efflux RND transporter periplasmic adaptor subunit [Paraburkholderia aspalathi]MBK5152269.1 efflux RND transporter periplasmic adaptor subunit [Burkholderia sp. R-69608]MBK3815567.1 efflux RND transporter periplasmic adaptor subunit [Paraburkholderia aspalathi]CAE6746363.1 p-hydroxybenzoic acid efflux pump subunit AaeA [Paraburkholderia nemoris]